MEIGERKKGSYSGGNNSNGCVEVERTNAGFIVRDTKEEHVPDTQQKLSFTVYEWECFIKSVKDGEFDI